MTVREILVCANVGRSAFYTHFRDKDDLQASCMRDMLTATAPFSSSPAGSPELDARITAFSLPLLEHVHRRASTARIGGRARHLLHEHLERVLIDCISEAYPTTWPNPRQVTYRVVSLIIALRFHQPLHMRSG
jgi:AcrR family transcriptional regulator